VRENKFLKFTEEKNTPYINTLEDFDKNLNRIPSSTNSYQPIPFQRTDKIQFEN
jgi:hypothetical protein